MTFYEKLIPDNSYLVFLDARSLYTSIPNSEGIKAVKTSVESILGRKVATKVITTFKSLNCRLKSFVINCKKAVYK